MHHPQSSAQDAAIRALRGESALDAVRPALTDEGLARVIACAPGVHPVVQSIAALRGGLPALLNRKDIAAPALHDALARLIGTEIGMPVIAMWVKVAPSDWGAASAATLIDAVRRHRCAPDVAAALIGPGDASAALLRCSSDAAFAIRCWGISTPDDPTGWMRRLDLHECRRLLDIVQHDPYALASCLPWLPVDVASAADLGVFLDPTLRGDALEAFTVASPTARRLHADLVRQIVADARPLHLKALTRLACAMHADDVWMRVQTLVRDSPDDAWHVVAAAPWDALSDVVRDAILGSADRSEICAAAAAARGRIATATLDSSESTVARSAFFAALDPAVWNALDGETRRRRIVAWLEFANDALLALRALGLRPEILARAEIDNDLVHAARRHTSDDAALRAALLPVALGGVGAVAPAAAHALIAAMPTPDDPGAFFCVASGRADPDLIAPARSALRAPADLACAVALQRIAGYLPWSVEAPATLADLLRGRTWDDLPPILALLDANARTTLTPDRDALVAQLGLPNRHTAVHAALTRLASLSPEIAIPTIVVLHRWTSQPPDASAEAETIAFMLRRHGDVFLDIADALADDRRVALLPLPNETRRADALRALVRDAPVIGQTLACALRDQDWRQALLALLTAPPQHAAAVWQALEDSEQRSVASSLPARGRTDTTIARCDTLAALALQALQSSDPDLQDAGIAALAQRPDPLRARWDDLSPEVQQFLCAHPAIAVAIADIGRSSTSTAIVRRCRTRRSH